VALRGCVQERVTQTVETFVGHAPPEHVRIEKEHGEFHTNGPEIDPAGN